MYHLIVFTSYTIFISVTLPYTVAYCLNFKNKSIDTLK